MRMWLPGRVAEARVDAVGALLRLLGELDAARAAARRSVAWQSSVSRNTVPANPFPISSPDLLGGRVVHHRRPGIGISTIATSSWSGGADGQPAEVAHLGERDVDAHLHAELFRVERERLVLVVDPQLGRGDPRSSAPCPSTCGRGTNATGARAAASSRNVRCCGRPYARSDAGRDERVLGRRRERGAVGGGGTPNVRVKLDRERADARRGRPRSRCRRPRGRSCAASRPRARAGASAGRSAATRRRRGGTRG